LLVKATAIKTRLSVRYLDEKSEKKARLAPKIALGEDFPV